MAGEASIRTDEGTRRENDLEVGKRSTRGRGSWSGEDGSWDGSWESVMAVCRYGGREEGVAEIHQARVGEDMREAEDVVGMQERVV